MVDFTSTYWSGKGRYESLRKFLDNYVPYKDEVSNGGPGEENHWLENYRLMSNAYYDIYNNGGCNWQNQLVPIMDVCADLNVEMLFDLPDDLREEFDIGEFTQDIINRLEKITDYTIYRAFLEQTNLRDVKWREQEGIAS